MHGRAVVDVEALAAGDVQLGGIQAELVENCGVDVGDVVWVFNGVKAQFVGCAMNYAGLYAAPGKPAGEALRMMVATRALRAGRAAELSAKHHQCILQHSAPLEILQKTRDRLVDLRCFDVIILFNVAMRIPRARAAGAVINLDEANALLHHAPSGEALRSELT